MEKSSSSKCKESETDGIVAQSFMLALVVLLLISSLFIACHFVFIILEHILRNLITW